ncbi:glutamine amidotransferase, class-I family protein [Parvularcula bermudensis HTCC2503]|uniref:Glutamine amidotransferase, class-I family protein n=1 Tax=Parvularcula bermudensis (strain ATCC BAA-594 / HTCC2503 / KCTC 12087) TaxID=314260 RepID=E0TBT7_PARBH|nr:type 1 glutamine amidotransferase [Parvularcula bermudensis]ADM08430.1 glutamine amidotransferase, class-I family protein [Parvularcula bermudensis HTCC2503]
MKLLIAETGVPPAPLQDRFPGYPTMMVEMLGRAGLVTTPSTIKTLEGERIPLAPSEEDAALIVTGSPAGVYEDHEWIGPLTDDIRQWAKSGRPMIGICFGHQIMAHAFGGRVELSDRGWGVGVHTYEVMDDMPGVEGHRLACAVSHKDQVVRLPSGAVRLGGSPFCPNGIIRYAQGRSLSLQFHPEFSHDFARALLACRAEDIPGDVAAFGRRSLDNPSDRDRIGAFLAAFLKGEIA